MAYDVELAPGTSLDDTPRATDITEVAVNGTTTLSASINIPAQVGLSTFSVPVVSTCSFHVEQYVAATWVAIPKDIDGTDYPQASFLGDEILTFAHFYGAPLRAVCASVAATLGYQGRI